MADGIVDGEESQVSWRRGWASAGAFFATLLLILLVALVTVANRAREEALTLERRTQNVVLLTRAIDASVARAEAALGRFVLDEQRTTGTIYYNEWRLASRQIDQLERYVRDPQQRESVEQLSQLFRKRGEEFAAAARSAGQAQGSGGLNYFYQAVRSNSGNALRQQLDYIARGARANLDQRMADTRSIDATAQRFTYWLGWLAVLIGVGAILLGLAAYRALTGELEARAEADSEAGRAQALEQAVRARTAELETANERVQAEAAERAVAEAKLHQVQKMEAVGQLTGGIAHDFNNMLAVIVGGLELARRKLVGDRRQAEMHLESAMEGANRAAALTRRLLAFARSEALEPEPVTPAALIEDMLDLIDRALGERIVIETQFPDEPWHVWADPSLLENGILNLCVNARDAMDGEGRVTIVVDNLTLADGEIGELPAGDYVGIAVADTGTGIAPEHLDRVFEPFFTTKPVGKGTGLGLSQLFGFARQSDGDVLIDSEPGRGTTVALYLPRSTREIEAPALPAKAAPTPPSLAGATILVVEDDPRVSRATVASLEELGYHTIATASGAAALEQLAAEPRIALVVSDVMMPEMSGAQLVRILAGRYPDLPVLLVTGYVAESDETSELTGYPMLRKPFTVRALEEAVAAALACRISEPPPASARPYVVEDIETHQPPIGDLSSYRGTQIHSVICVPLHKRDRFVAAMAVHQTTPRRWTSDEIRLVGRVASRCWESIERMRVERSLRVSERRFRDMADTAPAILWLTEPDGSCSFLSRGWYELTGQTEETGLGFGWTNASHPDDRRAAREAFVRANANREPYAVDFRVRRADGQYRWVIDGGRPRFGTDGDFQGFIGSVIDITERKEAEEERERLLESEQGARAEAVKASQMKDEFLATLSHELRTPLSAILGWSQILKRSLDKEQVLAQGLDTIERNARVQAQIIEDLLDMSRIISGKVSLNAGPANLSEIVRAAIETVSAAASAKAIDVIFDVPGGSTHAVLADPSRLQQVFWNLLSNAIKFTPRGGVVRVQIEQSGPQWLVEVVDSGEGITAEFLPYVFERFRQQDGSTTRRHGGLGLGLSIVKQLVELHGGTVRVSSDGPGRGATFTAALPIAVPTLKPDRQLLPDEIDVRHARSEADASGHPAISWDPSSCEDLAGIKVLVVDDEPDARAMLAQLFSDCNAETLVASRADEALALVESGRPDVLVSDIGMPDVDGYELLRKVRELGIDRGGAVPAIALTAYARAEDRVKAVRAGYQMHVPKPVEPAELIAMVASLASRR